MILIAQVSETALFNIYIVHAKGETRQTKKILRGSHTLYIHY